jgi:hypothetical protein
VGVTTKVTVALPKAGRLPKLQVTALFPEQLPWLGFAETKFTLTGKVSVIMTLVGLPGPLLATIIV